MEEDFNAFFFFLDADLAIFIFNIGGKIMI